MSIDEHGSGWCGVPHVVVSNVLCQGCPNLVLQERVADTAQLLASLNKLVKEKVGLRSRACGVLVSFQWHAS
mgnify:CR=1 FL=1